MPLATYQERIDFLREKEQKMGRPYFSCRSFVYGFLFAVFLSYFVIYHFIVSSDSTSAALRTQDSSPQRVISLSSVVTAPHAPPFAPASSASSRTLRFKNTDTSEAVSSKLPKSQMINEWSGFGTAESEAAVRSWNTFTSRDLILGIAVNINAKNFAIFVRSFRLHSPLGEAVVFVDTPLPDRHRQIATAARVRLVEFDAAALQPEFLQRYHASSLRWILFDRLLRANDSVLRRAFSRVVMVDVRDTAFQSDPFALLLPGGDSAGGGGSGLHVFGETPGASIESCGWNSGWVRDCFGDLTYNAVRASPVVCSGVSMGGIDAVSDYLGKMSGVLLGQSDLGRRFPACERNGVDQGVHNVLVHSGALQRVTVQYETDFPVVNLQAYPLLIPSAADASLLLSESGVRYAVVHQYDRLGPLQSALAARYVDWVRMDDPRAEWEAEPACAAFSVVRDEDLFRGRCELGSERAMSAASCCQSCQGKNRPPAASSKSEKSASAGLGALQTSSFFHGGGTDGDSAPAVEYPAETVCSAFTYVGGVCYMKTCRRGEVSAVVGDPSRDYYREPGALSAYVSVSRL